MCMHVRAYNVMRTQGTEENMIKIITANTSTRAIYEVIDEMAKNDYKVGKHVVIIPDAFALLAEKTVFERLGINGSMNVEVASFSRFAKKVLGDKIGHTLSKQGAVLYFKKTISAVQNQLGHYLKASATDGFAGEMYAVIASLRNNGISEKQLEESILKLDGTTKEKAKDILLLYKKYLETLTEFEDSTTRLDAFKAECAVSDKVKDAYFYLFGYDSLSKKQIEIITELAKYSKGVTIGLPRDKANALYPEEVYERLTEYLTLNKVEIREEERYEALKSPFSVLHDNVFKLSEAKVKNDESVVIFKESNSYEQYNAVSREILRLVRREGLRFKDIAVIDCGEKSSVDFKEILNRYAIPFFMDERFSLTSSLVCKYIVALFDVVRTEYRQDKVRAFIKNPLFFGDADRIALFENYILEENVRGKEFRKAFEYKPNTSKYADEEKEAKKASLIGEYEEIRVKLVSLVEKFARKSSVKEFVDGIRELVASKEFATRFEEAIVCDEKLEKLNRQSLERVGALLDEYEKLFAGDAETPGGFIKTFVSSTEAEEIALIPSYIDAVFVGSLRESGIIRQKAIFVLGATASNLPCDQGYHAIISALDTEKLAGGGIVLYPSPLDRMREERFAFIDLITKTDKLYIGYPENEFDGTQNKPSQAIKDVCSAFSREDERPVSPVSLNEKFALDGVKSEAELEDAVGQAGNVFYTFLMNGGLTYDGDKEYRKRVYATLSDEEKKIINAKKEEIKEVPLAYTFHDDNHTSISQIEQYFTCPYRHYLQYGLRLQERKEGVLRVTDVGTVMHAVLEIFFKSTKGRLKMLDQQEIERYIDEAVKTVFEGDDVQYLKKEPLTKFLLLRLEKESRRIALRLAENVLLGDFEPSEFEFYFGQKDGVNAVCFDTPFGKISFHGKIDRIDTAKVGGKDYAIAIDYKTGKIDADLSKVYYGEKVQLYLYLMAVRDRLKLAPAGSFYLPLRTGYTKGGYDSQFKGQFIFTAEMIKALDIGSYRYALETGEYMESPIIPLKFSIKNGEASTKSKKEKLSEEDLGAIIKYVEKLIPIALEEVGNGNIEKAPLGEGLCTNCSMRSVCGGCAEGDERKLRTSNTPLAVVYPEETEENKGDE